MPVLALAIVLAAHHAGHRLMAKIFDLDVERTVLACCTPREEDSFAAVSLWRRTALVAAGCLASYLVGIVPLVALMSRETMAPTLRVESAFGGSPAADAGVRQGDEIIRFNGSPVRDFAALEKAIADAPAQRTLELERADETITFELAPRKTTDVSRALGLSIQRRPRKPSLIESIAAGHRLAWTVALHVFKPDPARAGLMLGVSTGMSGQPGFWNAELAAMVEGSVLALLFTALHLLPVPGLDGWLLVLALRELFTGKRPDDALHSRLHLRVIWGLYAAALVLMVLTSRTVRVYG